MNPFQTVPDSVWHHPQVVASLLQAIGTVSGAVIVGLAGTFLTRWFSRSRDRQDKESQWRSHAVELTKLEMQRKLATWSEGKKKPQVATLDFLACYRDLQQLGTLTPAQLYMKIKNERISDDAVAAPPPAPIKPPMMWPRGKPRRPPVVSKPFSRTHDRGTQ